MIDIDYAQWRILHEAALKSMLRSDSGFSMSHKGSQTRSRMNVPSLLGVAFCLLMGGGFCALLVARGTPPFGEFLAISVIAFLMLSTYLNGLTNSLLSKESLDTLGVFPITTETFLASYFSSSIGYLTTLSLMMASPTLFLMLSEKGMLVSLGWLLSITCLVVFLCFATTFTVVLLLRVSSRVVSRIISIAIQVGSFLLFFSLIVAFAAFEDALTTFGDRWQLSENGLFLLVPPYWFLCLYMLFDGIVNPTTIAGSVLSVLASVPIAFYLFTRLDGHLLADLAEESRSRVGNVKIAKSIDSAHVRMASWWNRETSVMWKVAHSHLRFDSGFRATLISFPPVIAIFFLIVPIIKGLFHDPFVTTETIGTPFFVLSASLVCVFYAIDACRCSQQYRASWLLLMSPTSLSDYTVETIDWMFVTLFLPVLILLTAVFTFLFESFLHALLFTSTVAWQVYAMMNLKVILKPILPFTENLGVGRRLGVMYLSMALAFIAAGVISQTLSDWIYSNYASSVSAMLIGCVVCLLLRYLLRKRCDRKFRTAEFIV